LMQGTSLTALNSWRVLGIFDVVSINICLAMDVLHSDLEAVERFGLGVTSAMKRVPNSRSQYHRFQRRMQVLMKNRSSSDSFFSQCATSSLRSTSSAVQKLASACTFWRLREAS
jgi:hypothetical protein